MLCDRSFTVELILWIGVWGSRLGWLGLVLYPLQEAAKDLDHSGGAA